jgi:GAF domain-containing protein
VDGIPAVLAGLLAETGASRVTLRRDVPGDVVFPVVEEAIADGVGSLREERTVHLPTQPVVQEILQGRQVVQDDCASAYDDPAFHAMLAAYGGLKAQIVTPIVVDGRVCAILSLHQLGRSRAWTPDEIALCSRAAKEVTELL